MENLVNKAKVENIIKEIMKTENLTEEEAVKKYYKLSEEEHDRIANEILTIFLHDKFPVKNPRAIINIAPPASGKTGLNGYSQEEFVDNNVVIINSDELKPFHPKIDDIAKYYPQYYTKVTDQESNTWTSNLFDKALNDGYNVIFEGTGKNARILETIKSKMQKYHVTVRGMAVNELNCLMSILERYEGQVQTKGWGRLVVIDHFYQTYTAMPDTIDAIEKSRVVDAVEVFKRGSRINSPVKIYDSADYEHGRFPSAKQAVLGARKEDEKQANMYFETKQEKLLESLNRNDVTEAESNIINKMLELNNIFLGKDDPKKKAIIR